MVKIKKHIKSAKSNGKKGGRPPTKFKIKETNCAFCGNDNVICDYCGRCIALKDFGIITMHREWCRTDLGKPKFTCEH